MCQYCQDTISKVPELPGTGNLVEHCGNCKKMQLFSTHKYCDDCVMKLGICSWCGEPKE